MLRTFYINILNEQILFLPTFPKMLFWKPVTSLVSFRFHSSQLHCKNRHVCTTKPRTTTCLEATLHCGCWGFWQRNFPHLCDRFRPSGDGIKKLFSLWFLGNDIKTWHLHQCLMFAHRLWWLNIIEVFWEIFPFKNYQQVIISEQDDTSSLSPKKNPVFHLLTWIFKGVTQNLHYKVVYWLYFTTNTHTHTALKERAQAENLRLCSVIYSFNNQQDEHFSPFSRISPQRKNCSKCYSK